MAIARFVRNNFKMTEPGRERLSSRTKITRFAVLTAALLVLTIALLGWSPHGIAAAGKVTAIITAISAIATAWLQLQERNPSKEATAESKIDLAYLAQLIKDFPLIEEAIAEYVKVTEARIGTPRNRDSGRAQGPAMPHGGLSGTLEQLRRLENEAASRYEHMSSASANVMHSPLPEPSNINVTATNRIRSLLKSGNRQPADQVLQQVREILDDETGVVRSIAIDDSGQGSNAGRGVRIRSNPQERGGINWRGRNRTVLISVGGAVIVGTIVVINTVVSGSGALLRIYGSSTTAHENGYNSASFIATSTLRITYNYTCAPRGVFYADLNGKENSNNQDHIYFATRGTARTGGARTVEVHPRHPGERYYITVDSDCKWSIIVRNS